MRHRRGYGWGLAALATALVCGLGLTWVSSRRSPTPLASAPVAITAALAPTGSAGAPPPVGAGEAVLARARLAPLFDVLDCDRGGAVDPGEVDEHFSALFMPLDRDRSRGITPAEYLGARGAQNGQLQASLFSRADINSNGVLSAKEYRKHLYWLIERADSNRDGEVTRLELAGDEVR